MKKRVVSIFLFLFFLSAVIALSHSGEEEYDLVNSDMYPLSQSDAVLYGSLALGLLFVFILFFHKKMSDIVKKIVYSLVAGTALLVTFYLILTTLHLNLISETKGPVHWHADFEIWICDNEIKLLEHKGLSNMQGVHLLHAHNDDRIHVEGVLLDKQQASLGAFFHAVGGSLTDDGLSIPAHEGLMSAHNGGKCNEQPASLYVFVNGNLIPNPSEYVISPYEKVPPGDRIKIVFTEKPADMINPNLK